MKCHVCKHAGLLNRICVFLVAQCVGKVKVKRTLGAFMASINRHPCLQACPISSLNTLTPARPRESDTDIDSSYSLICERSESFSCRGGRERLKKEVMRIRVMFAACGRR